MKKQKSSYFQKLGKRGGKATADKHGADYMRKIGKRGGKVTRDKYINKRNDQDSQG